MRRVVQVCALVGIILIVSAVYFYVYETRSTGVLPYLDYPLRPYTLPLLISGVVTLILGVILQFHREPK